MSGEVVSSARSQADVTITMLLEAIQLDQLRSFAPACINSLANSARVKLAELA